MTCWHMLHVGKADVHEDESAFVRNQSTLERINVERYMAPHDGLNMLYHNLLPSL